MAQTAKVTIDIETLKKLISEHVDNLFQGCIKIEDIGVYSNVEVEVTIQD